MQIAIPTWWKEITLWELLQPKWYIRWPFWSALLRGELLESWIPVYEQQNAIYNHRNFRFYINKEKYESMKRFTVMENDLIVSCSGTLWKVSLIKEGDAKWIISQALLLLRPNPDKINPLYLYNYFNSKEGFNSLVSRSTWSVQVNLAKREVIENVPFLLPPLPEQRAIADMLSSLDAKIELLREQNETLEKTAQTIFHEWFGRYSIESLEELPEGWRVGKITEIIKREPVSYKCDKKDLDPNGVTPIIDQWTTGLYGYTSRNPDFLASPEKPVIVFTNHTCNYWFIDYSFCAIQNVLPYRGKDWYDEYFLYFMTKWSITFIEYKWHWPDFEAKDFIIPTVEKAKEFSSVAKPILEKISSNNSQIQSLSKTRDTLLPKLMSGEVRIA